MKKSKIKNYLLIISIVMVASILFTSCSCKKEKLYTSWVLEQYGQESSLKDVIPSGQVTPPAKSEIVLTISQDGKFSGNDGCNSIFGKVEIKKCCKIEFGNISSTLMMCLQPEIMTQATEIKSLMKAAEKYKVTDTSLKLITGSNEVLIYKKK